MNERILIKDLKENIGKEVLVKGWVDIRRDHGKLIFLDIRDFSGKVQAVSTPKIDDHSIADTLRPEWVVEVKGEVKERPENMVNTDQLNGSLELGITEIKVLNESETPPFEISTDGKDIRDEVRLKYRYLDLRRERMQKNIRMRDKVVSFFRNYMHEEGFVEIETPILIKDTPEGAREFVVPSRLHNGNFYVLPQSPQQLKQLSMIAGFERYFQIARCFRDEDSRGDRQPEFTQLDYEMSFVGQEDILNFTEKMFIEMVEEVYPEKEILSNPFPRLTYAEAMEKYDSDKPDLRKDKNNPNELAFAWITEFPMYEKTKDGEIQAMHHPFTSVLPEDKEKFMNLKQGDEEMFNLRTNAYDLVLNGYELSSGSIRIHDPKEQSQVFNLLNIGEAEQQERFGHMLEAFKYGAPPHGGFAPGIDRVVMILQNEPNISEVIAYPKTREARDLMLDAPSEISDKQLKELGIEVKKPQK